MEEVFPVDEDLDVDPWSAASAFLLTSLRYVRAAHWIETQRRTSHCARAMPHIASAKCHHSRRHRFSLQPCCFSHRTAISCAALLFLTSACDLRPTLWMACRADWNSETDLR
eukprot:602418-Rhodomonas_salina.1